MTATELLDALRTKGVHLAVEGEHVAVDAPQGVLTDDLRQAIREHKQVLLALLVQPMPVADPVQPSTAMGEHRIELVECWDLPPCRQCGGRLRWLNANLVPIAPWFMHCGRCSPPPTAAELGKHLAPEDEEGHA